MSFLYRLRPAFLSNCVGRTAQILATALFCSAVVISASSAATVEKVENGDQTSATLYFNGPIVVGDLGRLQAQTATVPAGKRIVLLLESPGGLVDEGFALGRYIYTAKITTVVINGSGCHSACTYMFLAGRDKDTDLPARIMMKGTKIGFHQIRPLGMEARTYSANDMAGAIEGGQNYIKGLNAYLTDIKADPEFLTMNLSAPSSSLTYLNELDALRLGIYVMEPISKKLLSPAEFKSETARQ